MELEINDVLGTLSLSVERLSSAAQAFEVSAARLEEREAAMSGEVRKITAAVEQGEVSQREQELERRLLQAEQRIADLLASQEQPVQSVRAAAVRKTLPAATVQLLAKQGVESLDAIESSALDAALCGLSVEQRIAVKSQLYRSGAMLS